MRKQYIWSEEADATLRQLCADEARLSAATIAITISVQHGIEPPISKASVIGRARREGISLPTPGAKRRPAEEREPAPVYTRPSMIIRPRPTYTPVPRFSRRVEIIPEDGFGGLFLLNVAEGDCRRPLNDPPKGQMHLLKVCADPVREGSNYCPACHARVYTSSSSEAGRKIINEEEALISARTKKETLTNGCTD